MAKSKFKIETRIKLLLQLIDASYEDVAGKVNVSLETIGKAARGKQNVEKSKEIITEGIMYVIEDHVLDGNENPLPEEYRTHQALMDFLFDKRIHKALAALPRDMHWLKPVAPVVTE